MYNKFKVRRKILVILARTQKKPLAKTIIFLAFVVIVIQSVFTIIDLNTEQFFKLAGYFVGNVFLIFIFIMKPKYLRWVFIIISLLLLLTYIKSEEGKSQFHYQLVSNMILSLQFVIIATGEFLDALLQIIIIFLVQIIYFIKYQENFSISILASVIMVFCLLTNSFYKNNTAERSQFQLTLIEEQWDQVLIHSITTPSIIFNFDLIKNCFSLKKAIKVNFPCGTNEELKHYLRITKLVKNNQISLEKVIYENLNLLKKTSAPLINKQVLISFQKVVEEIKYSIFPGASPIIIIQLIKSSSIDIFDKIEKLYQFKYLTLLRSLQVKLKFIYKQKNKCPQLLKLILYRNLQEKSKNLFQVKELNLKVLLKKLGRLFQDKKIKIHSNCENMIMLCQKYIIILILMEIFESAISNEIVVIIEKQDKESKFKLNVVSQYSQHTLNNFQNRCKQFMNDSIQIFVQEGCILFLIKNHSTIMQEQSILAQSIRQVKQ